MSLPKRDERLSPDELLKELRYHRVLVDHLRKVVISKYDFLDELLKIMGIVDVSTNQSIYKCAKSLDRGTIYAKNSYYYDQPSSITFNEESEHVDLNTIDTKYKISRVFDGNKPVADDHLYVRTINKLVKPIKDLIEKYNRGPGFGSIWNLAVNSEANGNICWLYR